MDSEVAVSSQESYYKLTPCKWVPLLYNEYSLTVSTTLSGESGNLVPKLSLRICNLDLLTSPLGPLVASTRTSTLDKMTFDIALLFMTEDSKFKISAIYSDRPPQWCQVAYNYYGCGGSKKKKQQPCLFKLLWLWHLCALPIQMNIFVIMLAFELCYWHKINQVSILFYIPLLLETPFYRWKN